MAAWNEIELENEICDHLQSQGWLYSKNDDGYDKKTASFPQDLFDWLKATQPRQWEKVVKPGASQSQQLRSQQDLLEAVGKKRGTVPSAGGGTLSVLRRGFSVPGARFVLFQPKPPSTLNQELAEMYAKNRLRVMRQVHYSAQNRKSIDLVLFLNGLPIATIELKTDLTQNIDAALRQYRADRQPQGEPLLMFGKGALVHFAVSNELVYMATKLEGAATYFLPFNKGYNEGAGNPPVEGDSPSSYLWKETFERGTWLDLIANFMHYRESEKVDSKGRRTIESSLRFPRYHQHRVVARLEQAVLQDGPGTNYLIQHSAGSGKTDSIAWTAHRMASLHNANNEAVFQSILVISDRTAIDDQLRRAIKHLSDVPGVFAAVTRDSGGTKSSQLAQALARGAKIIGVTLQTVPFAVEEMNKWAKISGKKYAVIADEAHSSQTGSAAKKLKEFLGAVDKKAEVFDTEDLLQGIMAAKSNQYGNITFFAFTATPKSKTVELFGRVDPVTGKKREFDLYPMKQAIQEKFILDVLKNYISYDLAFKLSNESHQRAEQEVDRKLANKEIMKWVRQHPHNIAQKSAIIVDHFDEVVAKELNGQAKAMVVTGSRLEAAQFKKAMDQYITDSGLPYATLVAFSGALEDGRLGPEKVTERDLNLGTVSSDIPREFGSDRFQILVVANKFQTGFDQPKLVGMYVDKKIGDIAAVQTLSRLNRTMPGKEQTFVVDFVNDPQVILSAFQEYYEDAELIEEPNYFVVTECLDKIEAQRIIDPRDVDLVVAQVLSGRGNSKTISALKPAADIWKDRYHRASEQNNNLEMEVLDDFCATINAFIRAYDFYSQVLDYGDTHVEKMSIYLRLLIRLIGSANMKSSVLDLEGVTLTHYKLTKNSAAKLTLEGGQGVGLSGLPGETGSGTPSELEPILLEALIREINDLFAGSGLDDTHQINAVSSVLRVTLEDDEMQAIASNNSKIDFEQSPRLGSKLDEIIYDVDLNTQKALGYLATPGSMNKLINILMRADLYEKLQDASVGREAAQST